MNTSRKTGLIFAAAFALLYAYAFNEILRLGMLAYGDCPVFPQSANQAFSVYFSSWLPSGLGYSVGAQGIMLYYQGLLILICGGNASLAQKVYMLLPFVIAHIGMYVFLGRFVKSSAIRHVSAFFYAITPMTTGTLIGGATGMLYVVAMFPFAVDYLLKIPDSKKRLRDIILFSVFFAFGFSFGAQMAILLMPFLLYVILKPLFCNKRRSASKAIFDFLKNLSLIFASGILILILLSLTLLPIFDLVWKWFGPIVTGETSPIRAELGSVWASYAWPRSKNPLLNTLTVQWTSRDLGFGINPFMLLFGLMMPMFAFYSLLFKDEGRKSSIYGYTLLAISVTFFITLTGQEGKPLEWLWMNLPFLQSMPNPANPCFLISFAYSVLISITLDNLQGMGLIPSSWKPPDRMIPFLTKDGLTFPKSLISLVLCAIIILSMSVPNWIFFTGSMGPSFSDGTNIVGWGTVQKKLVPKEFYDIADWIKPRRDSEGFFRTFWLPFEFSEEEIKLRYIEPNTFSIPGGVYKYDVLGPAHYNRMVIDALMEDLPQGFSSNIGSMLSIGNVKYVIVYLKSNQKGPPKAYEYSYASGNPRIYAELLNKTDLELIYKNDDFLVYKNNDFLPHVQVYSGISLIMQPSDVKHDDTEYSRFLKLLSSIPDFSIGNQLLVFSDQLTSKQLELFGRKANTVIYNNYTVFEDEACNLRSQKVYIYPISLTCKTILAYDDFSQDLSQWISKQGSWSIKNGELYPSSLTTEYPYRNRFMFANKTFDDFVLEVKIKLTEGGSAGITFRYQQDSKNYEVWLSENYLTLSKWLGTYNSIVNMRIQIEANKWYSLKLAVKGSTFRIYIDGDLKVGVSDQQFGQGELGVITYRSQSLFDDFLVYDAAYSAELHIPENGYYEIATNALVIDRDEDSTIQSEPFSLTMDDMDIPLNNTEKSAYHYLWWCTSDPIYLKKGIHNATIEQKGSLALQDELLIIPTTEKKDISEVFNISKKESNFISHMISWTESRVEIQAPEDGLFILFGEPYHQEWNAYSNGKKLEHFNAHSFLNGFYIDESYVGQNVEIRIQYDLQPNRDTLVTISSISWILTFFSLLYTSRKDILKTYSRIRNSLKKHKNTPVATT